MALMKLNARTLQRAWIILTFVPVAAAVIILSVGLRNANSTVDEQQRAIEAQQAAQKAQNHVLTELCRTNAIILGLVKGTETLFKYEVGILPLPRSNSRRNKGPNPPRAKPLVPTGLVPYYLNALEVFIGWEAQLEDQTACAKIVRP